MATRRPSQFWAEFNEWARTVKDDPHLKLTTQAVAEWWTANAEHVWPDAELRPSLQDARRHAKGIRSKSVLRQYFRDYRRRRKSAGLRPKSNTYGNREVCGSKKCQECPYAQIHRDPDRKVNLSDDIEKIEGHGAVGILPKTQCRGVQRTRCKPKRLHSQGSESEDSGVDSSDKWATDDSDLDGQDCHDASKPCQAEEHMAPPEEQPHILSYYMLPTNWQGLAVNPAMFGEMAGIAYHPSQYCVAAPKDLYDQQHGHIRAAPGSRTVDNHPGTMPLQPLQQKPATANMARLGVQGQQALQELTMVATENKEIFVEESGMGTHTSLPQITGDKVHHPGSRPALSSVNSASVNTRSDAAIQDGDSGQPFVCQRSTVLTRAPIYVAGVTLPSSNYSKFHQPSTEGQTLTGRKRTAQGDQLQEVGDVKQQTLGPETQRRMHVRPGDLNPATYASGSLPQMVTDPAASVNLTMPRDAYSEGAGSAIAKLPMYALPSEYSQVRQPPATATGSQTHISTAVASHHGDTNQLGGPLPQQALGELDAAEQEAMLFNYCFMDDEFGAASDEMPSSELPSGELPTFAPAAQASTLQHERSQQVNGLGAATSVLHFGGMFPGGGQGYQGGLQYPGASEQAPVSLPQIKEEPGGNGGTRNWAALTDIGAPDACERWNGWMPEPNLVMQLPPIQSSYPYQSERQQEAAKLYGQWQPSHVAYYQSRTAAGLSFCAVAPQPWAPGPMGSLPPCYYPPGENPHYPTLGATWNPQDMAGTYEYQ